MKLLLYIKEILRYNEAYQRTERFVDTRYFAKSGAFAKVPKNEPKGSLIRATSQKAERLRRFHVEKTGR